MSPVASPSSSSSSLTLLCSMVLLPTFAIALAGLVIAAPQNATSTSGSSSTDASARCAALAKINLKNVQVTTTKVYSNNTTFTEGASDPAYPAPVPALPSFCRYAATVTTSAQSSFKFEVWLPVNKWNGRWSLVCAMLRPCYSKLQLTDRLDSHASL